MKARNVPGCALLWWMLCLASPLSAASGVVRWESTFHREPGSNSVYVAATRELADGTTMTVTRDGNHFTALRYDHAGALQSSAILHTVYPPVIPAIDPFGAVFVTADASAGYLYETDVWIEKYDGLTGEPLWPSAVTWGAGNQQDDHAYVALVDPAGDLVVGTSDTNGNTATLLKYGGTNGGLLWGPVTVSKGQASYAPVALDAAGNVFQAYRTGPDVGSHLFLLRRDGATGALVWRVDEVGHDLNPGAVGVDGSGNVLMAGGASAPGGSIEADKYAGATGQRIWGPALDTSPADARYFAGAVFASDGSVVVYGLHVVANQPSDFVLKFRGADGATAWGPVPLNVDPQYMYSADIDFAGNGDVVVSVQTLAGSSWNARTWRFDGATGGALWGPQVLADSTPLVRVVSNGRVFEASTVSGAASSSVQVMELDGATGAAAWGPRTFTGAAAGYTQFSDLTASPDGNVVATGTVEGTDGSASWATLKYDKATGNRLWGPKLLPSGSLGSSPFQVLTDGAGDVLVAGLANGNMQVVKYSGTTGTPLWQSPPIPGHEYGLALDASGNAFIQGWVSNGTAYDVALAKISGVNGSVLWGPVTYDSGGNDFPDRVATDATGDVFVAGHSDGGGPPTFLLKYSGATGALLWGPIVQSGQPSWLAVDGAGDVFEVISSPFQTIKYSGIDGAVLWGPLEVSGYGAWVAIDTAGDAYVAGSVYTPATGYDYAVVKYHGSDGAVLWGPMTYDGGGNDYPYAVVLDGSGNVVVTGDSDAGSNEQRSATLSYDGATGALRWGPVGRNVARGYVNGLAASGSTAYVGTTRGDLGFIVDAIDESLGIATPPGALPALSCGHAIDVPLGAVNGTPPYTWSIVGGGLPSAVVLGANGDLIGTPQEEGVFAFRAQVQDASLARSASDFTLAVGAGGSLVPISVARDATCQLTVSVDGSYSAYDWLPDGQTTPQIVVDPLEPTPYGVVLNDGTPCAVRGAVTIVPFDPSCLSPSVASIAPSSGPGAGTPVVVSGAKFEASAALSIGGLPAVGVVFLSASAFQAKTPSLPAGTVADVLVVNPDGRYGLLLRAFAADFLDVPGSNPFYADVMKVLRAGITAGCSGGNYCPNGGVTRAQMAVFLLKAQHGFFYVPPPCAGMFADVACPGAFAADWIEQLAHEGITAGCGGGDYCPDAVVTREQMAAFLLKAEHGSSFVPPPCEGVFGDVPCSSPFASWIEQLYAENITGGCGNGNYCPSNPNTRAQMATFLGKTFQLP